MMNEQSLNDFLKRFAENRHTEQEHTLFIDWLNTAPIEEVKNVLDRYQHISGMQSCREPVEYPQLIEKIEARLNALNGEEIHIGYTDKLWTQVSRIASIAAIFLVITALGLYFYINLNINNTPTIVKNENGIHRDEITPGGDKAVLTLSDGSTINLDNAQIGLLAIQDGVNIRKIASGQIIYEAQPHSTHGSKLSYNTITTPRGGQYQLVLPDGSKVWLNAASSLTFPASFSSKERKVALRGEAYFEVAKLTSLSPEGQKKPHIPFKVSSGNQILEVLGTHFNVNAYPDEATINTTLLEGSVKIEQLETHRSKILKPGQEAKVGTGIHVSTVDVAKIVAWKNGYFIFSHENIESIMRKISRWYDVDINYQGNITQEGFVGSVSKFEEVSQVLDLLQLTGSVHFKIKNLPDEYGHKERRIIVMP